jgi:hypothetical protein
MEMPADRESTRDCQLKMTILAIDPALKQYRFRHSREGGNPAKNTTREADKCLVLSFFAREYSFNWIPAFADMTRYLIRTGSIIY